MAKRNKKKKVAKRVLVLNKKKKVVKRVSVSKKKSKSIGSKKTPSPSRKDFEVFAQGVERLEELSNELKNLNTVGYDKEVVSIKSKLKNVSYIPEIEREMKILKRKIKGTYKRKVGKSVFHSKVSRKINVLKSQIPKEHAKIHRKIKELEDHIPDKEKLNRKIKELEKEIDNNRVKKQLSGDEVKLVKNIPNLRNELNSFKRFLREQNQEEKRKEEMLRNIDPEVSFLINDKFNLSLNEIKRELSRKLQGKELAIQKQLQSDLEDRKKNFDLMYKDLEKRFEKKYHEKVDSSLRKEIRSKFDKVVAMKIGELRNRIIDEEKKKMKNHFDEQIIAYRTRLNNKMHFNLTEEVKKLHEEFDKKKNIEETNARKLNSKLLDERRNISKKIKDFESKRKLKIKRIGMAESLGEKKLEEEKRKILIDEKKFKNALLGKNKRERELFVNRINKEKKEAIKKAVALRSSKILNQFKSEFDKKLRVEIKRKETEFEKKKNDLVLEVQRKARTLLI